MKILRKFSIPYLTGVLLLQVTSVAAQNPPVPMLLNYQGQLKDAAGVPKNGTFSMTFRFFDAATGGRQLPAASPWTETQLVAVSEGVFNVLLGSVADLPDGLFEGGPADSKGPLLFLEVTVENETLAPRKRVGSAAYAIQPRPPSEAGWAWFETLDFNVLGASGPLTISSSPLPAGSETFMVVLEGVGSNNATGGPQGVLIEGEQICGDSDQKGFGTILVSRSTGTLMRYFGCGNENYVNTPAFLSRSIGSRIDFSVNRSDPGHWGGKAHILRLAVP